MKKYLIITCCLIIALCGCADIMHRKSDAPKLKIETVPSDIYSEKEINDAIKTVERYFSKEFDDCYLTEIRYAGDERLEAYEDAAAEYGAQQAIILISSFYVTKHGGDGSLKQDYTYEGWSWTLTRGGNGDWNVRNYGYA